jgi:flavin-dependent dehydrogenase
VCEAETPAALDLLRMKSVWLFPCSAVLVPAGARAASYVVLLKRKRLAGDAAGFIDPMTGDGLRFAVRGGELAAVAALEALEHGWRGVHERLAARRRQEFGGKWRFNRALRALVTSPRAVDAGGAAARLAPGALRAVIAYAGDCGVALSR